MQKADSQHKQFELICVIVNFGLGSKVLSLAKKSGMSGGTIVLGRGTVHNRWLELLELTDVRKEVVLMIGEKSVCRNVLTVLDQKFNFRKPNHGIAFTMPVGVFIGTGNYEYEFSAQDGGNSKVYNAIFVVVDKGKGEEVMDVAAEAGARGGTIINARGSGIHETATFLNMEIEPEKEVVLMLIKVDLGEKVVKALRDNFHIDQPGNGIIFVQSVNETYGLVTES
ncbi:MAG: P-II family nitrogen regulator [Firmicutes bacterium]|nr:P-II family nitrogen regulator [Bacillota bacterium]